MKKSERKTTVLEELQGTARKLTELLEKFDKTGMVRSAAAVRGALLSVQHAIEIELGKDG